MTVRFGYCTNVHAATDLEQLESNLARHAVAVRQAYCGDRPMGLGLWLPAAAARGLRDPRRLDRLAQWLDQQHLIPFTLNGFPYGDFHKTVVKHDVYQPDWADPRRLEYTLDLIHALDGLLPPGAEGSISTLPIGWGHPPPTDDFLQRAAQQLCRVTEFLAALQSDAGRLIHVCLEPEPGCVLSRSDDVLRFFDRHLLPAGDDTLIRKYLRICHDTCHAAVMFEDQREVIERYAAANIAIGKVQISSAIDVDFDSLSPEDRQRALEQLQSFVEPRYLHQTCVQSATNATPRFYDDLPKALDDQDGPAAGRWRVHFHVPIFAPRADRVATTQEDIRVALQTLTALHSVTHFEVETYAWNVLPPSLRAESITDGIAQELHWAANEMSVLTGQVVGPVRRPGP